MGIHRQIALMLAAALAGPVLGADNSAWSNLSDTQTWNADWDHPSGHEAGGGKFRRLHGSSGISVRTDREINLRKEEVVRVYRRPRASRPIRAAVGAAIGAAGGAILSSTVGTRFRNEGQECPMPHTLGAALGLAPRLGR